VIVGMQITSINETGGFTYCRIQGCATVITEGPNVIIQIRPRAAPSFHTGCLVLVTGIKIYFVVLHLARGPQVAHPCRILYLMQVRQLHKIGKLRNFLSRHKKRYLFRFIDDNN